MEGGLWDPIVVYKGVPKFSHLMFVDNVLLFCKARSSQVRLVLLPFMIFAKPQA